MFKAAAKGSDEEWGSAPDVSYREADGLREVLAGVDVFEDLTGGELRQVERIVHERAYLPREVIVRQGHPGVGMYIIRSGSARVVLEEAGGRTTDLATLSEGQLFGEMSLLDGAPRAASVVANERSRLIGFFQADLMDLIGRSPRLGFKIVLRLSQMMELRLRETLCEYRNAQRTLRRMQQNGRG